MIPSSPPLPVPSLLADPLPPPRTGSIRGTEFEDTYEGDREREHIVEYALRMNAPVVTPLADAAAVRELGSKHLLFFVYAGEHEGPLWEAYSQLAERFRAHHYFYSCAPAVFEKVGTGTGGGGKPDVLSVSRSCDMKRGVNVRACQSR